MEKSFISIGVDGLQFTTTKRLIQGVDYLEGFNNPLIWVTK